MLDEILLQLSVSEGCWPVAVTGVFGVGGPGEGCGFWQAFWWQCWAQ